MAAPPSSYPTWYVPPLLRIGFGREKRIDTVCSSFFFFFFPAPTTFSFVFLQDFVSVDMNDVSSTGASVYGLSVVNERAVANAVQRGDITEVASKTEASCKRGSYSSVRGAKSLT